MDKYGQIMEVTLFSITLIAIILPIRYKYTQVYITCSSINILFINIVLVQIICKLRRTYSTAFHILPALNTD